MVCTHEQSRMNILTRCRGCTNSVFFTYLGAGRESCGSCGSTCGNQGQPQELAWRSVLTAELVQAG
jgi:hypothetical protein